MTIIVTLVATIPFVVASQNSSSLEMLRMIHSLHQTLSGHSSNSLRSPLEKGVHGPRGVYPLLYMTSARDGRLKFGSAILAIKKTGGLMR